MLVCMIQSASQCLIELTSPGRALDSRSNQWRNELSRLHIIVGTIWLTAVVSWE